MFLAEADSTDVTMGLAEVKVRRATKPTIAAKRILR
jgi:hypothetical protein